MAKTQSSGLTDKQEIIITSAPSPNDNWVRQLYMRAEADVKEALYMDRLMFGGSCALVTDDGELQRVDLRDVTVETED